jgi:hypothetical protein
MALNMGLKTLQFFITDVPSTVFSVKTGRIENEFGIKKGLVRKIWSRPSMTEAVASAISVVIQPRSFLTPSKSPKGRWKDPGKEFSESVGRLTVQ